MDSVTHCCPNPALPLKLQVVLQPFLEPSLILNGSPPLRFPNSEPLTPVQGTPRGSVYRAGLALFRGVGTDACECVPRVAKHPTIPTSPCTSEAWDTLHTRSLVGCASQQESCPGEVKAKFRALRPLSGPGGLPATVMPTGPRKGVLYLGQGQQG